MAIDTNSLVYLIDPFWQGEGINGKPLVGGYMTVFYAGTDLKYITYQNFDGTENPFKIPLGADGRATILVEAQYTYDCYLYDSFGNLAASRLNVKPNIGGGNISIKGRTYHGIEPVVVNNQYNLISARNIPLGVQEPLYFVEDSESACIIGADTSAFGGNSTLTLRTNGIKDGTYDTLGTYTPLSGSKNIDIPREVYTFTIGNQSCFYNDVIMAYLNSKVLVALEIESWYEGGQQKQNVYENFAQKQFWGNNNFYNGGYVNFVRVDVEKNQIVTWKCEPETPGSTTGYAKWTKTVTDLGSGGLFIAEYGNPGTTYEEIDEAFNAGKTVIAHKKDGNIDQYYQLCEIRKYPDHTPNVDCYVFAYRYSYIVEELFRFQSNWSNMATHLATWDYVDQQISAGDFATHADLSSYATQDWVNNQSYMHEYMESAFYPMESNPSGYLTEHQSLAGYMQESKLETADGKITGYDGTAFAGGGGSVDPSEFIPWSASGDFQSAGNYATTDDLTGYQEKGDYYSASNPSGFINSDAISAMATTGFVAGISGEITAMIPTALTGDYLTKDSADTLYYPLTSNPSGYLTTAEFAYYDTAISSIDNSALYDTSAHARINTLAGRINTLSSNKADVTALADYQTTAGMTAYLTTGDSAEFMTTAERSDYIPTGVSSEFYTTANTANYISEVPDTYLQNTDLSTTDGKVTAISGIPLSVGGDVPEGVMVESGLEYNAVGEISGYGNSAIAQYGAEKQWLVHDDTLVHAANSAQYALGVNLSAVAQLLGIDETVLWEGSASTGTVMELSAPLSAFRQAKLYMMEPTHGLFGTFDFISGVNYNNCSMLASISRPDNAVWSGSVGLHKVDFKVYDGTTKLSGINNNQLWLNVSSIIPEIVKGNGGSYGWCSNTGCKYKVIGIGRKA